MGAYDPQIEQDASEWLALDELERIELVASYHRRERVNLPNPQLHATIHVVIENQLAMGIAVVVETIARLQNEGLDRHDALHAIGSVLAGHLYRLLQDKVPDQNSDANREYLESLKSLTAEHWLNSG